LRISSKNSSEMTPVDYEESTALPLAGPCTA
jgi:hypothetical protein